MTRASRIVVAGAGYTGGRLLESIGGEQAIALTRTPGSDGTRLDLDAGVFPATPPHGDYSVVYTIPPSSDDMSDVRLERFLDWLRSPPARFVYVSTSGVYGDCGGALVDERHATNASSDRSKRRVAAEQALLGWCRESGSIPVILRAPAIFGPGRLGLERIRSAKPVIREQDAHPGNRVHVDDLLRCCIAALDAETPPGIYNASDGDHRSSTWFTHAVADIAGLPRVPEVSRREAERQFSASRLSFLKESRRLDNGKMRRHLLPEPSYETVEDAIRASL